MQTTEKQRHDGPRDDSSRRSFLKKLGLWIVSLTSIWSGGRCDDPSAAGDDGAGPARDAGHHGTDDAGEVDASGDDDAGWADASGVDDAGAADAGPGAETEADGGAYAGTSGTGPRVVKVTSKLVTSWDFSAQNYWEYVDAVKFNAMFDAGLLAVAGAASPQEAWRQLLTGYRPGDRIAIKPNLNNGTSASTNLNPLPATFLALIDSLVQFGVREPEIAVYEAAGNRGFNDYLAAAIHAAFPGVRILNPPGAGDPSVGLGETSFGTGDADETIGYSRPAHDASTVAACLVDAAHLINVPILRSHFLGGETLITGALKNHYGSISLRHHDFQDEDGNPIAEVNLNPHIRGKTRLVLMEGIFGRYSGGPWGEPQEWTTFPEGTPQSLLFSSDPVAVDSVAIDLVLAELAARGISPVPHAAQHAAEALGLGVHDHVLPDGSYAKLSLVKLEV